MLQFLNNMGRDMIEFLRAMEWECARNEGSSIRVVDVRGEPCRR